ncbi:UDP-N-acetyl-D-glucosamine dehydrogenase [Paenibacillus yonginensis]|uniref:UDP-N-acetyl-D-glucosamine dehydrogenase n=1 Tax=Paenibacillus yonginensis TaxID=1462996 RepID=A0A1B1N5X2_9BACL|nr:nucleotide sugar dehydrogenase [Paenibacillus yonginensis]ANS76814.1 UDP-N-acetyl-D-glucosamine dehydrogenase [Paenibacillus yonginensis]
MGNRLKKVAVVGLGYVGLPLALAFSKQGYKVTGIDLDERKLQLLKEGRSYIQDIPDQQVKESAQRRQFSATREMHRLREADVIIICVPTPLNGDDEPDLTYLMQAAASIRDHLRRGQIIVLESSTYPGTTREVLKPLLEQSGLSVGTDVFLGYSPERVDPGNRHYPLEVIPKVVSGITDKCARAVEDVYKTVFQTVVRISSTDAAEMTKLLENTYRFVNISFINEIAQLCNSMGIDVWEVIEAARSKPFGFSAFFPSPGAGGHCIPVDPLYLQWRAKQFGATSSFIAASREINHRMPRYIVERIKEALSRESLSGVKILVVGVAFKPNIDDTRESSAIQLIECLQQDGAAVSYYDPYVHEVRVQGKLLTSVHISGNPVSQSEYDCAIIAVNHEGLPLQQLIDQIPLVYDTRNALKGMQGTAKVIRLGGGTPDSEGNAGIPLRD